MTTYIAAGTTQIINNGHMLPQQTKDPVWFQCFWLRNKSTFKEYMETHVRRMIECLKEFHYCESCHVCAMREASTNPAGWGIRPPGSFQCSFYEHIRSHPHWVSLCHLLGEGPMLVERFWQTWPLPNACTLHFNHVTGALCISGPPRPPPGPLQREPLAQIPENSIVSVRSNPRENIVYNFF